MMILKANGNGNGSHPPYAKIGLLALAVAIVGFLFFRQVDRLRSPVREVWVAADTFASGRDLASGDLVARKVRAKAIPEGAILDPRLIQGKQLAGRKEAGEFFFASDLEAPAGSRRGSLTGLIPEGRVLVTLFINKRSIPYTELSRGDRLAVFATGSNGEPHVVARDALFVGSITSRTPQTADRRGPLGMDLTPPTLSRTERTIALMLALQPEDVFAVVEAQAANAKMSAALHGKQETQEDRLLDLSPPREGVVELINGPERQTIATGS